MPTFKPKMMTLRGHMVRYEDIHTSTPQQPDWVQEALELGEIVVSAGRKCLEIPAGNNSATQQFAYSGDWILCRPDDTLLVVSADRLASEYDLVS